MKADDVKLCLVFLLLGLLLGGVMGAYCYKVINAPAAPGITVERDTSTTVDTLPDYQPAARDSGLVRWMVVKVPVKVPTAGATVAAQPVEQVAQVVHDTVEVTLPVEQKHYQGEGYQAWVSGYRPALDSIQVYQKTNTITETITITQRERRKRWGVGIVGGVGYDFTARQAAPFIGLGVSYNLFQF